MRENTAPADALATAHRPGLRERKKRETHKRIARAARKLFLERGFEATTIDEIAAAASVSRRNFFHYFSSKEDALFAWREEIRTALTDAIAAQGPDEPLVRVARRAVVAAAAHVDRHQAVSAARIVRGSPALHARNQARYHELERLLAARLGQRLGGAPDRQRARLVAMVAIGALRVAVDTWLAKGGEGEPLGEYVRRVFRKLTAEFAD